MAEKPEALRSSRADEPELAQSIEAFLLAAAERLDHLQDAERAGTLAQLARGAAALAREAGELGFAPLAVTGAALAEAAAGGRAEAAHRRLVELTDLVQRARRSHRPPPRD